MIKIFNTENELIELVENLKDFVIVDKVKNGFSSLLFSLYRNESISSLIKEEFYVETQDNRYVVKSINKQQTVNRYTCELDLESLKSKIWTDGFSNALATVDATVRLAIAGTGWTVETDNLTTKKRKIALDASDSYEVIKKCLLKWDVEVHFNARDKVVTLSDKFGTDKGVYFSDELNLKSIDVEGDSYDFATRLYVKGKDGLTFSDINNGKDYVEDFSYSSKLVAKLWVDERYDNKEQLLEDARRKLKDLCEPKYSYEIEVVDLSNLSDVYSFLSYSKGDTVTLMSRDKKIRETHRIVEISRYPLEPERNTVTLSNGRLTLEELQEKNENMADAVDLILNEDGSVIGSKVDNITTAQISDFEASVGKITDLSVVNARIENLEANKASIGQLSAVEADIGELRTNSATIDQLKVTNAKIDNLEADNVTINGTLQASNAQIKTLEVDAANIKHLLAGNISSENIQSGGITSDKLTIANGFIKDAMIDSLNANKITAGTVDTSLVNVSSESGNLVINDNTIQIRDDSRVRVQIGKDSSNDYSMSVWDSTGKLMFDARGLKADAIKDSIIRNDMISPNANIEGSKLNINSVVSSINDGTTTFKASKVAFDGIAQTLDVAFNELKTKTDETKSETESNTTAIKVAQGKINTLIQDTTIVKDGVETKLKDEYSKLEQTVSGIDSTVGKQQTTIDEHTGKITATNSEISKLNQTVSGLSASVSTAQKTIETHTTQIGDKANIVDVYTIEQTDSQINLAKDEINLGVSNKYSTKVEMEGEIDSVLEEIETVREYAASIDIKADGITSKVDSVEQGLNNRIDEQVKQLVDLNAEIQEDINEILSDDIITDMEKRMLRDLRYEIDLQYDRIQDTVRLYNLSETLEIIFRNYQIAHQDVMLAFRDSNIDDPGSVSGGVALQQLINTYLDAYNQILYGIAEYTQSESIRQGTLIEQTDKKVETIVSTVETINGVATNVSKHMAFSDNWLELYGTINGAASRFKARLSDTRLSFYDGGNEVAYISNQKMFINEAEIVDSMKIGKYIMTSSSKGGIVFRKS